MELLKPFDLFDLDQCQQIIHSATVLRPGRVAGSDPQGLIRNNHIYWLDLSADLKNKLWSVAQPLMPQYKWTWFEEPVQISRYSVGQYYDWHTDVYRTKRSSQRVLTLTCTLMAADQAIFQTDSAVIDLAAGQAVFFPSNMRHRATAPNQGQRWSLTVWYMAPSS